MKIITLGFLFTFSLLIISCGQKEGDVPKKSDVDRLPRIQIDSPHDSVNVARLEDFDEGKYVLDSVKVLYYSPKNNYEIRFEDFIGSTDRLDSAQLPDRVWMDWDAVNQRLPAISFSLPMEFYNTEGQFVAGKIEGYEALFEASSYGLANYDDLYGFGLFGEDVDITRILIEQLQLAKPNDNAHVSVGRHYSVLERTPGAFRVLVEYENEIEKVTINLHYINPL